MRPHIKKTTTTHLAAQILFFVFGFSAFLPHGLSAAVLFAILCFWLISGEQRRLHIELMPPKSIILILIAFSLWPFLIAAYSGWFTDTTTRLFHMARVGLMLQMGLMTTSSERLMAFKGLVWGAFAATAVVLIHQIYPLPEWQVWHHLLAVKGSQSSRAMIMLALTAGVCMAMFTKTKKESDIQGTLWMAAALLFAVVVGVFSISRNAQIVLMTMPLLVFFYRYRSVAGLLTAAVFFIFLAFSAWNFFPNIEMRFSQAVSELQSFIASGNCESSVGVRFAMYKLAFNQLMLQPWFGTGIGSFVDYWIPLAQKNCPDAWGIRQPHNDFLLFAMESGWVGLLTVLAIVAWFIKTNWRQANVYGMVGILFCWAFLVTGMVNSPMRDAGVGFVMIFLMATCSAKRREDTFQKSN